MTTNIFDVFDCARSNRYDDIIDYCNQTGQNICDVYLSLYFKGIRTYLLDKKDYWAKHYFFK